METGQLIVIIISVFFLLWYLVFSVFNRQRGIATYYWLRQGLAVLGEVSEANWIGSSSSGAQLIVGEAKSPFKRFGVMFMLQPRDILPKWIYYLLLGRQDDLVVKAALRKAPKKDLRVARRGDKEIRKLIDPAQKRPYQRIESLAGFDIAYKGTLDEQLIERLAGFLTQYQEAVLQMSLKKEKPHFELRLARSAIVDDPAEDLFTALGNVVGGNQSA